MAKIHVLEQSGLNTYHVAVHAATPGGNNGAGVAYSVALVGSGQARTRMTEGTGPGQITTAEKASVEAGTTIEAHFQWEDDPNWTNQERLDDLDLRANQLVTETLARFGERLKYFGFTRT